MHRRLTNGDAEIALNPKCFELLCQLVENHGEILSKDNLLETVWPDQFVEENNLTVQISALRKAFGDANGASRFIATIPGKGYSFVAPVDLLDDSEVVIEHRTVERITVENEEGIDAAPLMLSAAKRNYLFPVASLALLAVIAGGAWWAYSRNKIAPIQSIAVMPFTNESQNPDNDYLSDGMTESLINSLSRLPTLTVKARNSVFTYKDKPIEPTKIASELSVQAILLGRIVERGDNITISLELVDAATNDHLWGEQYSRKVSELATLQNDIARDVSDKLRRKFAGDRPAERGGTANAEAYQLYLRGRYLWNKRNADDHLKAKQLFDQAIAIDPNFALAYAAIGDIYTVDTSPFLPSENRTRGREMGEKALSLEPELAEAYAVLAKIEWDQYRRDKTDEYFVKALDLNPNYASAYQWRGEALMQVGRNAESLTEIRRAVELDPLSAVINSDYAYLLIMDRQYDAAIEQSKRVLELDPGSRLAYLWLNVADEYKDDFDALFPVLDKQAEIAKLPPELKAKRRLEIEELRAAVAKDGKQGYWRKLIEVELLRPPPPGHRTDYYYIAIAYAMLGDKEKAIDNLEKELEMQKSDVANQAQDQIHLIWCEPPFESLRGEPRFVAILHAIGIYVGG